MAVSAADESLMGVRKSLRRCLVSVLAVAALAPLGSPTAEAAGDDTIEHRWEILFPNWDRVSSPQLADVNRDGRLDIAFGAQDGWLRVVNSDGVAVAGWPRQAKVAGAPVAIDSTPGIGDLDNDGSVELAVGVGSTWKRNQQGGAVVFNANGTTRCTYRTLDVHNIWTFTGVPDGYTDGVFSSPAIGDVDGDGFNDVVFGGFDLRIHAIDRNCRALRGFPYYANDTVWSSPALYDVDRDGRQEIFIGADWYANGPGDPASGGRFRRIDWNGGAAVATWTRAARDVYTSSPAIGDIDGDGRLEAVVGGGDFFHQLDGHRVFAYHLDDGSTVSGWPQTTSGVTMSSPALGDLTGDGRPEVVIGSRDGQVHAYRGNGSALWHRKPQGSNLNGSPIISDLDGDGDQDVGIGNSYAFYLLRGNDGAQIGAVNTVISYEAAGAVGNFGADGRRLVTIGFDTPLYRTRVRSFPLPDTASTDAWPMFGRSARNLRAVPSDRPLDPECHGIANRRSPSKTGRAFVLGPTLELDGAYDQVVAVNANGDSRCDFLLYGRGAAADALLRGAPGAPALGPLVIDGEYDSIVSGDFNGDGYGDALYYAAGTATDRLRRGSAGGLRRGPDVAVDATFDLALSGDFNGDGKGDVLFYGRGASFDRLRLGTKTGFRNGPSLSIDTDFDLAVAGDFNGDRVTDIFFYGRGRKLDRLKLGTLYGVFVNAPDLDIDRGFDQIVAGDFNGDGPEDLVLYGSGTSADYLRRGTVYGVFGEPQVLTIDAVFAQLVAGDLDGDLRADLVGYGLGPALDRIWLGN